MKRPLIFVLLVFFLLSCLAGCGREKENGAVAVEYGGTVFLVDKSAGTIRGGSHTYTFENTGSALKITYPDGSIYTWQKIGEATVGSGSKDPSAYGYASASVLREVLSRASSVPQEQGESRHTGIGILLLLVGIVNTVWPRAAWYLGGGWRYKDAEPSDTALFLYRAGGIVAAVIGFFLLFS